MRDYLAVIRPVAADGVWYGIPGMRWGRRRTEAQLAKDPRSPKGPSEPEVNAGIKAATGEETSAQRYARLAATAKGGGASSMSEQDLKFFNARTDAVNKVNKMFEEKPGWIKSTITEVAQQTAQKQLANAVNTIAGNYINEALKKKEVPESLEDAISKKVADLKRKDAIEAGVNKAIETSDYIGTHKKALPGTAGYRGKRVKN